MLSCVEEITQACTVFEKTFRVEAQEGPKGRFKVACIWPCEDVKGLVPTVFP